MWPCRGPLHFDWQPPEQNAVPFLPAAPKTDLKKARGLDQDFGWGGEVQDRRGQADPF